MTFVSRAIARRPDLGQSGAPTLMVERQLLKYRLLEEVGHGGMAIVNRGMDTTLNREVAVKILHAHLAEEEESKQRFQREAQAVAKLRHDNIIEIFDYSGIDSPESFIVTEFIHGQTLKDYLARHPISHPEIAVMVIVEVLGALHHAHSLGVIHRDIKPENIMIRDDGRVKLTDFGIAQVVDVQRLTVTGQLLGSPAYMAPELVEGKRIDFRADVFSVGVLLYQLATAELPFKGKNPHEVLKRIADGRYIDPEVANPVVGTRLARMIRKGLAHDPEARYSDVDRFQRDLLDYLGDVEISEPRIELTRYFAAPPEYSRELQARVVQTLTARGKKAFSDRRTPAALEYFNRVLCVDPTNKEILDLLKRITRRRQVGRALALVALAGAMGGGAYLIARHWPVSAVSRGADLGPIVEAGRRDRVSLDQGVGSRPGRDGPSLALDQRVRMIRVNKLLPIVMRQIEIVPTPKAVTIWMNDRKLGDYGPDLRQVTVPLGTSAKLTFRNDACCFEKVVQIAARQQIQTLRIKLPWKPARLKVVVVPVNVEADVQVGSLVTRAGQLAEVPIPAYSEDGADEVEIKVSAAGYATVARKVKVRANTVVSQQVELRRLP
jgi:serine/threonine-protein kinase